MSKKNYFDNDAITKAIIEYKLGLADGQNNIRLLHPYTSQIQQLVRGVINTHKIYRWWNDIDELVQEGIIAVYGSFQRYDPAKGSAFNYLSITVKNHLKNWTQSKNKKNWLTGEFNDEIYQDENELISDGKSSLEDLFYQVDVPRDQEPLLMAVIDTVLEKKIHNKRDVVKFLLKLGHDKKDIDIVFGALEDHFGGFLVDDDE